MKTTTLLISGKQGSGKTTLAREIIKRWETLPKGRALEIPFAKPLYEMHDFLLGYMANLGFDRDIVKDGPLLQYLGTDWGRKNFGDNVWVDANKAAIEIEKKKYDWADLLIVIPDCRFQNELFNNVLAKTVRLECAREIRKARCSAWRENDTHPSEIDLDHFANELELFDLTLNTGELSLDYCVGEVMNLLAKEK